MCKLKASLDTQIVGMVTVCDELQRLLKLAFIGERTKGQPGHQLRIFTHTYAYRAHAHAHTHTHTHTHMIAENGMLATRIEILARYHGDTVKKLGRSLEPIFNLCCIYTRVCGLHTNIERKIALTETENRVTRKQLKRLRKRQLGK